MEGTLSEFIKSMVSTAIASLSDTSIKVAAIARRQSKCKHPLRQRELN